jgi:hypothetical protein
MPTRIFHSCLFDDVQFSGHADVVRLLAEAGASWSELSEWCNQAVQASAITKHVTLI